MNMKTALYAFVTAALCGMGLIVGGVYVLLGSGPALLAAGGCMLIVSAFLRAGLKAGAKGG